MNGLDTDRGTAALRAIENAKGPSALTLDQFAATLADRTGMKWANSLAPHTRNLLIDVISLRTRFIDDYLHRVLPPLFSKPKQVQVVILGAGSDARAYRLHALSRVSVFEIDYPGVLAQRAARIQSTPLAKHHVTVDADLSLSNLDEALLPVGFAPTSPTVWIMEGLTGYLAESTVKRLVRAMYDLSAEQSTLVATFNGTSGRAFGKRELPTRRHIYFSDDGAALLASAGWNSEQVNLIAIGRQFHRSVLIEQEQYGYWLVMGEKNSTLCPPSEPR